jgi:HK97 family phage portal protein
VANIFQRILGQRETRTTPPVIPPRSTTQANPETALTLTAVARAVQILATPVSKMELETYRFAGGIEQKIENPIFVNRPSIMDTRRELLYQLVVDLALYGNAYLLKQFDSAGRIVQVFQLPAFAVGVRYNDAGTEKLYDYSNKTYSADQIEHLRLMPRSGYPKGTSILETCSPDVKGALDLRDYQANWFSASGVPTGVIKSSRDLTAADAEAMTAAWHTKQANRQIAVLGNGFDFQHVQLSPRDALMTEVASQSVQQIARMFGIPARLLLTGVDGSSDTYTNLQDENQVFYRHTLMAYTDVIADAISNCLPRGTRVKFDYQSLFAADMESRFQMWSTALAGEPFMTVDEVRERENL